MSDPLPHELRRQVEVELQLYGADKAPSAGKEQGHLKRFRLLHIGEVVRDIRPPEFLICGVIETETMGELFGDPGSYKTFLALSMLLCVASGRPWYGHPVKQGPVVYIVGEGRKGVARRLAAWGKHHCVDLATLPFFMSSAPAALTDQASAAEVAETIAEITEQHGPPAMIVIDTMARNFGPGDENSTRDMSVFVANLDKYLGNSCVRMVVHHSGHGDKNRSRGNSALRGAVDFQFCLAKKPDGAVEMSNPKMKDAPEWQAPKRFKPRTVFIGGDFDNPIESIVLEITDQAPEEATAGSAKMQAAIDLLRELYAHHRANLASGGYNPDGARVTRQEWRTACLNHGTYTRTAFYRMEAAAEERGLIRTDEVHVYLVPADCLCVSAVSPETPSDTAECVSSVSPLLRGGDKETLPRDTKQRPQQRMKKCYSN